MEISLLINENNLCCIGHYRILYSSETEIEHEELKGLAPFEVMINLDTKPPLEDLQKAIKSIPGNKASGNDCLSTEIYKCANCELLQERCEVTLLWWKLGSGPTRFHRCSVCTIIQRQGGTEVTVMTMKVSPCWTSSEKLSLTLCALGERIYLESQCGFCSGFSTIDMIFSVKATTREV